MIHPDDPLYLRIQRNNRWLKRGMFAVIALAGAANLLVIWGAK